MKIILDVTELFYHIGMATGVKRVVLELSKYLISRQKEFNIIFACFIEDKPFLHEVNGSEMQSIINRIERHNGIEESCFIDNFYRFCKSQIKFIIPRKYHPILRKVRDGIKKLKFRMFPISKVATPESGILFNDGDVFIFPGLTLSDYDYFEFLSGLKRKFGIKFVGVLHDIIPVTHPHVVCRENLSRFFSKYLNYLCGYFDRIGCISDYAKETFKKYIEDNNLALPELKTIHLGSNAFVTRSVTVSDVDSIERTIKTKNYVLYVGTIEIRKNHLVLLKAWLKAQENSLEMPTLICVGRIGWKVEDMFSLYNNNPFLKEKILFLHSINDDVLHYLYSNCLFTVFPSIVEGWGLGVTESLAYGKVCIISTAPALNEAAQGLMPRVDPCDVDGWVSKIVEFTTHEEKRKELEANIRFLYRQHSWGDFAKEFITYAIRNEL